MASGTFTLPSGTKVRSASSFRFIVVYMVRETIAYALDPQWEAAYGHPIDQWKISGR
jgi:hypothetical protein